MVTVYDCEVPVILSARSVVLDRCDCAFPYSSREGDQRKRLPNG